MVLVHEIHQVFARKLIEDFARELLLGDSERGNVCVAWGESRPSTDSNPADTTTADAAGRHPGRPTKAQNCKDPETLSFQAF